MGISCFRLYDHDLPEFPFCIEFYSDKLYVAEYKRNHRMSEEAHEAWIQESLDVIRDVLGVNDQDVYLKLRQRKPGRLGQYQRLDQSQNEIIVWENDLQFIVNLSDYLDTGLFLDHRITRQMLRERSEGKKILNLFAYTGSFSVYAAAGGALAVDTVDLSRTYLAWAARNMQLNSFSDQERYRFIHADVKQYLPGLKGSQYDIIIMDPPTFSNSKRMKEIFDIQQDHVTMINQCLDALQPGGLLYFSTNYSKFVLEVSKIHTDKIKDITRATTSFDFEKKLKRPCFLIEK